MVKNEIKTQTLVLYNLKSITEENIAADEDYFVIMRKNREGLAKSFSR
jgi:ABC-type Zn uptake system ZnuABC Zn-binding protein ZnuA